jgi:hypothetical protein
MALALRREGPGQDLVLAQHYQDRFDMGVMRMKTRLRGLLKERVQAMGSQPEAVTGLGPPRLPTWYPGPSTRISGSWGR